MCIRDSCPFRDQGDYLPFPLIYEYLILKKQKRHPEADMGKVSSLSLIHI